MNIPNCKECVHKNNHAREEPCDTCFDKVNFTQNPIEILEDVCPELKGQVEELKEYCNQDVEVICIEKEKYEELKRLIVREAPHTNDCTVWINDKGNIERCTCWKAKAFKILGVELNEN